MLETRTRYYKKERIKKEFREIKNKTHHKIKGN